MRALVDYWSKDYDWRKAEARLNRYPQFIVKVGDFDIHFYHVRSTKPNALPIVLTHGWPGSVVEFQEVIQPLRQDFDLVIPSLPGFGFSSKPNGRPVGALTTAKLWHELMTKVLGYHALRSPRRRLGQHREHEPCAPLSRVRCRPASQLCPSRRRTRTKQRGPQPPLPTATPNSTTSTSNSAKPRLYRSLCPTTLSAPPPGWSRSLKRGPIPARLSMLSPRIRSSRT